MSTLIKVQDKNGTPIDETNPFPMQVSGSNGTLEPNADGSINVAINNAAQIAKEKTATIAAGASLSGSVDLNGETLIGIKMPSAWTTAVITLKVSNDNVTFYSLKYNGSEFTIAEAGASVNITIDPLALNAWRYVKIQSGTNASNVNQVAAATFTLLTKPIISDGGRYSTSHVATIASSGNLSDAIDLAGESLWGIIMPSAWTAAVISFSVSNDGTTYQPLRYNGSELTVPEAAASVAIAIDPIILNPWRYLKVQSGTSSSTVAQDAERAITLLAKPA